GDEIQWVPHDVTINNSAWMAMSPDMEWIEVATVTPWEYGSFKIVLDEGSRAQLLALGVDPDEAYAKYMARIGSIAPAPPVGYRTWGLYCRYTNAYHHGCDPLYV